MSQDAAPKLLPVTCCIVGGGPAGIMLSLLLARAGVNVAVCEKHPDFNRDFRGDTVHPATLQIMHELGLLPGLLALPHQDIRHVGAVMGGTSYEIADFTHLPVAAPQIALLPQWDLLNFLAAEVRHHPDARVLMQHRVTRLLSEDGVITGAHAETPDGPIDLHAALTVACDGRHSTATEAALLEYIETGVPIDVLWFRLSRRSADPEEGLGFLNFGRMVILINRGDYFQCGYIIRKGAFDRDIVPAGLPRFRRDLAELVPFLAEPDAAGHSRLAEITGFDQLKLLTFQVNRLRRWHRPGLLVIGDAAHAMLPVGGIGINLAIQDAVAAANLLTAPLLAAQAGTVATQPTALATQPTALATGPLATPPGALATAALAAGPLATQPSAPPTQALLRATARAGSVPHRTSAHAGSVANRASAIARAAAKVQRRRELPTRLTQLLQILAHHFLNRFLGRPGRLRAPLLIRLLNRFPLLRRIPGRLIGMGLLPEHPRLPTSTWRSEPRLAPALTQPSRRRVPHS